MKFLPSTLVAGLSKSRIHWLRASVPSRLASAGFLALLLAFSPAFPANAQVPATAPTPSEFVPKGYKLSWHDEFDGNALDATKWQYRLDARKRQSVQKAENVSVSGGNLILNLTRNTGKDSKTIPYAGAGIITKQRFLYGYYEARYKVPKAQGWHTSFWLMGYNPEGKGKEMRTSAQEIDICEQDSFNPYSYSCNFHKWTEPKKHFGVCRPKKKLPDLSEDFYIWGCEVTPTKVDCYFNGERVKSYPTAAAGSLDPYNIWLTSVVTRQTSKEHGSMKASKLPDTAEFDYVRFYEKGQ